MSAHHNAPPSEASFGILFAEDFDDHEPRSADPSNADPAPIIEPSYTAEDLAQAYADGVAEGRRIASDTAARHLNDAAAEAMGKLEGHFAELRAESAATLEDAIAAVTQLLFQTLDALLPILCRSHDAAEISGFVRDIIAKMDPEVAVRVRVASPLVEPVRAAIEAIAIPTRDRVRVEPYDALPLGDAKLNWDNGAAMRSAREVQNTITEILQQFGLLDAMAKVETPQPTAQHTPERTTEKVASHG